MHRNASHTLSRVSALVAMLVMMSTSLARAEITPDAKRVVERYLEAIGGADAVRAIHSLHMKATVEAFGLTGSTEVWARNPDLRATRTEIGPFKLLNGFDGASGWRTDPTGKISVLDGKDLEDTKTESYFENDRWLAADQGGGKVALVAEPDAGREYSVVEVVPPSGRARRFWINAKTGLVDKATSQRDQMRLVSTFSDYRLAPAPKGAKPRLIAYTQGTQIIGMPANDLKVTITQYEPNATIDDAIFQPPAQTEIVTYLKTPGVARLPFDYRNRHVWVRASVNGQPAEDFIYDTGASVTVIDSAYAAKLGLERQGALQSQGAGSAGSASLSKLKSLRVEGPDGDGVELKDQSIAVLSVNPFLAPFFWRDCAGIIGYDFIARFVNEVDYDHERLVLRDPKTFKYEGKGTAIPMRLAGTVPVVTMKIDDQYEGEFRLDVGSSSAVDLHTPFVTKHDLRAKAKPAIEVMGGGFGGTFVSTLTRMKKMAVGPYSWTDPMVTLSSTTEGALASEDYAGNVGNQILERFICTFDYDHKTLYLEPGAKYATRDKFSRSGVQLAKFGDTVKAMQVLKGSAAEKAGIRVEDVVLTVNGKPVASWDPEGLRDVMEGRAAGDKVTIEYERDGIRKKTTMRLAEIL